MKKNILLNPLFVFTSIWILMIMAYFASIAEFMTGDLIVITIFLVSLIAFFIGFLSIWIASTTTNTKINQLIDESFYFNFPPAARFFLIFLAISCLVIFLFNLYTFGYPPIFHAFGYNTFNYLEYGRLKAFFYPMLILFMMIGVISKNYSFRFLAWFIPITIMVFFEVRGSLISALICCSLLYLHLHKIKLTKLIILILLALFFVISIMGIMGEIRTGSDEFLTAMRIKSEYSNLNIGLLWVITYISAPIENIVAIVNLSTPSLNHHAILTNIMPAFLSEKSAEQLGIAPMFPNPQNTVSTYLSFFYLDLGWPGIFFYNIVLGATGGVVHFYLTSKKYLFFNCFYLSNLYLIFFYDFFFSFQNFFISIICLILAANLSTKSKNY